jgi:hypothetical protein
MTRILGWHEKNTVFDCGFEMKASIFLIGGYPFVILGIMME